MEKCTNQCRWGAAQISSFVITLNFQKGIYFIKFIFKYSCCGAKTLTYCTNSKLRCKQEAWRKDSHTLDCIIQLLRICCGLFFPNVYFKQTRRSIGKCTMDTWLINSRVSVMQCTVSLQSNLRLVSGAKKSLLLTELHFLYFLSTWPI